MNLKYYLYARPVLRNIALFTSLILVFTVIISPFQIYFGFEGLIQRSIHCLRTYIVKSAFPVWRSMELIICFKMTQYSLLWVMPVTYNFDTSHICSWKVWICIFIGKYRKQGVLVMRHLQFQSNKQQICWEFAISPWNLRSDNEDNEPKLNPKGKFSHTHTTILPYILPKTNM